MSRQWVIIDDSDTNRIQYDGQWLSATPDNDINGLGNFGVPFKNSLHALNTNGSLSFSFNGSAVRVYGTTRIKRVGAVDDPLYECILDGANIPINPPLLFPENNWVLCQSEGLATDKEHNITVRATVQSMTFYFDRVIYTSTNTSDFDASSWHLFEANHPSVSYGSGWSNFRDIGNYTTTNGASVTISYFGKSVIFAGAVPGDFSVAPTTAQYAVDNGKSTTFRLAGLPSSRSMEQYNQAFFQTPLLPQAQHTLKVSYGGNNSTTPLTLNFFMVQRDPIPPNGSSSGGNGNNTNHSSDGKQDASHEKSTIGVAGIVGGVVGGIVLMGLLVALVLWLRRHFWRRRRRAQYLSLDIDDETVGPFDPFVDREWDPSTSLCRPSLSSAQLPTSYPMAPTITGATSVSGGSYVASTINQESSMSSGSGWGANGRLSVFSVTNADTSLSPLESSHQSLAYPSEKKNKYIENATSSLAGTLSTKIPSSSAEHSAIVVHHEDSGIRLGPQPGEEREVIDVPPTYTPG